MSITQDELTALVESIERRVRSLEANVADHEHSIGRISTRTGVTIALPAGFTSGEAKDVIRDVLSER